MSVSIYYTCERNEALSSVENKKIAAIVDEYNTNFQWQAIAETFYVYDQHNDPPIIFEGSTKLPLTDDYEVTIQSLFYWLECLTAIRNVIDNGEWHVHLDDVDAVWDEEKGWKMPSY
ncbi:hypothetical protein [Lysinibacillus piscis]|uniref:Short-chain dehydrogenase n=1 Tax=Lysinibacillus piscis TaxID=2518931 RepID=A0ABQ5NGE1_9BACI|nr:hypothetical protein [Lysinibacillus sp. KH24]GLC87109.1 hypothetical protein LYSBPC_02360 [Lysinibacillus sp. KH24]